MDLLSRLKSLLAERPTAMPQEPIVYRPIGVVRNRVHESRPPGWEDVRSDIILRDDLAASLDGIEGFSHVIVLFHMQRVPENERRLRLMLGTPEPAERGVLASRSQLRPNPIGASVARVLHRRKGVLRVQGLDALSGTPVLDIKPYLPAYDAVAGARLPDWAVQPPEGRR